MGRVLFLDQTGQLGGAELALLDTATRRAPDCLVALFDDGPFRLRLEEAGVPVDVIGSGGSMIRRSSSVLAGLVGLVRLLPLVGRVARRARGADLIYANTQKAAVVGALAAMVSRRPLVVHLHDLLVPEHFSRTNVAVAVRVARRARAVITNSEASRAAYVAAGGDPERTVVVDYGFDVASFRGHGVSRSEIDPRLGPDAFVVGCFSRLSPWKGQHVLLEALSRCPDEVVALFVGEALFGEDDYTAHLHREVGRRGLEDRVVFLGFRPDVPALMAACDLVAHTSIHPEPFGRVIVEAMLSGCPVVASDGGGVPELVEDGVDGRLFPPGDAEALAQLIIASRAGADGAARIEAGVGAMAGLARERAALRYDPERIGAEIDAVLDGATLGAAP